jgi:hypothetical protein
MVISKISLTFYTGLDFLVLEEYVAIVCISNGLQRPFPKVILLGVYGNLKR